MFGVRVFCYERVENSNVHALDSSSLSYGDAFWPVQGSLCAAIESGMRIFVETILPTLE
jgi:hypothetical protein